MNPRKRRPLRLGLTGGIGSGKSTVGTMLVSLGASLIDADQIARDLAGPHGAAMHAIRAALGSEFVDAAGAMDRNSRPRFRSHRCTRRRADSCSLQCGT